MPPTNTHTRTFLFTDLEGTVPLPKGESEPMSFGVLVGVLLLLITTAVAFGIGAQAARSVRQFREESHERFAKKEKP